MPRYNPASIEPRWQAFWESRKVFAAPKTPQGEKLYVLDMFPYPSGEGLHVGHPEGYTATDIVCRFERMRGKSVLHPMGWDAFGLPAEQHAIKTGTPPRETTEKNIANFRRQLKMLGFSYDWDRELSTTDVEYFRWTQWIFLLIYDTWYDSVQDRGRPIAELPIPPEVVAAGADAVRRYQDEHRLAYQQEAPVNWCSVLGTVLSNEEVKDGLSERGGHPVTRIPLRQWMLRITAYAERLERDLESLDWPKGIKTLQKDWIGRSSGAEVDFPIAPSPGDNASVAETFVSWSQERRRAGYPRKPEADSLRIYTTRPDTLFGATYMVIAPEHPLVDRLTRREFAAQVDAYRQAAARKSDLDRAELSKTKTGVFTGAYAINPVHGGPIPIWIADYVLMGYGTGAIMAVPGHDERDFEFAQAFGLPILAVVDPREQTSASVREAVLAGKAPFVESGHAINSPGYDGLPTDEFRDKITADLATRGAGRTAVNYKLRDWLFSRQHFWGEPFPILRELDERDQPTGLVRVTPPEALPIEPPTMAGFKPHGRPDPPLEEASHEWLYPVIEGRKYKRETNTMPQWAGSCWYYLRFIDPRNSQALVDRDLEKAWMPVDLYIGGAEHAVLHLLYARFWHKVLFDRGVVTMPEPFRKLVNQGMILGAIEFTGYRTPSGEWVSSDQVKEDADRRPCAKNGGAPLVAEKLAPSQVVKKGDHFCLVDADSIRVDSRAHKMSKSRGNVINPDDVVKDYGADSLRLYEMFMGPLEAVKPWSMDGVNGVRGFLDRAWRMIVCDRTDEPTRNPAVSDAAPSDAQNRLLHKTIQSVTRDYERLSFNTAIAKLMEFTNAFTKDETRPLAAMRIFTLLLSPMAPHIAEEMWQILGGKDTLAYEPWPTFDSALTRDETIEIPVQILGKLRGRVVVAADASSADLESAAKAEPRIAELLRGKTIVKAIVVPGKLVNFVVK